MSAFCVFGMTLDAAIKRAEKKLAGEKLTMDVWKQKVREAAEQILISAKPIQVSPPFDAPQFAEEWIAIARKTSRIYGACVMVRKPKHDKKGNPVIGKASGLPLMAWQPYRSTL